MFERLGVTTHLNREMRSWAADEQYGLLNYLDRIGFTEEFMSGFLGTHRIGKQRPDR